MRPAKLPPMPFTLPKGSILTAQSGCHLHFLRLPFPFPFWSFPDSALSHSLLVISPSFKPLVPVSLPPPHFPSSPRKTRHSFLLALYEPARMCGDSTSHPLFPSNPPIPRTLSPPPPHVSLPFASTPLSLPSQTSRTHSSPPTSLALSALLPTPLPLPPHLYRLLPL
jgi:hypothetical protein